MSVFARGKAEQIRVNIYQLLQEHGTIITHEDGYTYGLLDGFTFYFFHPPPGMLEPDDLPYNECTLINSAPSPFTTDVAYLLPVTGLDKLLPYLGVTNFNGITFDMIDHYDSYERQRDFIIFIYGIEKSKKFICITIYINPIAYAPEDYILTATFPLR